MDTLSMGEVRMLLTLVALAALVALLFMMCRRSGMLTWGMAWMLSPREEKVGLTRAKGHYNANGYLVSSDSDIQLDVANGSFQRFDHVDRDFRLFSHEQTRPGVLHNMWGAPVTASSSPAPAIPPQPLRPAPAPQRPPIPPRQLPQIPAPVFSASKSEVPELPVQPSVTTELDRQPERVEFAGNENVQAAPVVPEVKDCQLADEVPVVPLKRAMSCDSLSSDTSVVLGDLEEPNVTGYLCVGLEYDKTMCLSELADLVVSVIEAKDLTGPVPNEPIDSYVRVYLLPDKSSSLQTRVYKHSTSPTYKEKFMIGMEPAELSKRSLMFYVYASDKQSNTLIGEAELRLSDVTVRQPVTTWLTLTDTGQKGTEFGELMFSLSYLPTAERLTVVVVKARNLRFPLSRDMGDPFVKVYLLQHGKKVHKKKTSTKKSERSPIFNEAMIFSVPAHALRTIQLRLTVAENTGEPRAYSIGHVIVGSQATGKPLSHWNQMLTSLRKPIAMWHPLRK